MLTFVELCALFLTMGEVFHFTAVRGGILGVTVDCRSTHLTSTRLTKIP